MAPGSEEEDSHRSSSWGLFAGALPVPLPAEGAATLGCAQTNGASCDCPPGEDFYCPLQRTSRRRVAGCARVILHDGAKRRVTRTAAGSGP